MENPYIDFERIEVSKCKVCLEKTYNFLFDFYEFNLYKKKPFMMTTCGHVFHSSCLEAWIRQKRECPTCRSPITLIES
jgi:hypothetical protein